MITKKQVEALKKAKKEEIKKLARKAAIRAKLDPGTLLLQKTLKEKNKMLYEMYKSGDLYVYLPRVEGRPIPEKELLKKLLDINHFFQKMKYAPSEREAFGLVAVVYKANVPLKDLEEAVKEIDKRVKDPEERRARKSAFLRKIIVGYKTTGYRKEDLVKYALEQTLRIRGEKTTAREGLWRTSVEGAAQRMEKLGIEDRELERLTAATLSRGKEVNVDKVAESVERISRMNPAYGEQAREMVKDVLSSSMASGRYTEETMQALEERLEEMEEEVKKRTKKRE